MFGMCVPCEKNLSDDTQILDPLTLTGTFVLHFKNFNMDKDYCIKGYGAEYLACVFLLTRLFPWYGTYTKSLPLIINLSLKNVTIDSYCP